MVVDLRTSKFLLIVPLLSQVIVKALECKGFPIHGNVLRIKCTQHGSESWQLDNEYCMSFGIK